MDSLPQIPGFEILSVTDQQDGWRRFRLGVRGQFLVLFDDVSLESRIREAAAPFQSVIVEGQARVLEVTRVSDGIAVLVEGEVGESPWNQGTPFGEAHTLPILHHASEIVAGLAVEGVSHGLLRPHGFELLPGGMVQVLPPVACPGFVERPTEGERQGEDLLAIADMACQLVAGLSLIESVGVGVAPEELKRECSPATAHAIRILVRTAGRQPTQSHVAEALARVGWAKNVAVPRQRPRMSPPVPVSTSPTPEKRRGPAAPRGVSTGSTEGHGKVDGAGAAGRRPVEAEPVSRRPARRPRAAAVAREEANEGWSPSGVLIAVGVLVLGGLLLVFTGDGLDRLLGREDTDVSVLPEPNQLLPGGKEDAAATAEAAKNAASLLGRTPGDSGTGGATTAEVDAILHEIEEKRRTNKTPKKIRSYDRSLIDEGDQLQVQGKEILRQLRDGEIPKAQKNEKVGEAIQLLESAREKYDNFIEQYPSRERLVEGALEDVNALIFFAYRQRTLR